jgi:hypothetical protein
LLLGLKATPVPLFGGNVAGLAYLVPKPEPDHGYAVINGESPLATAIAVPAGLNATLNPLTPGKVAGLEYLDPNPEPDHGYAEINGVVE